MSTRNGRGQQSTLRCSQWSREDGENDHFNASANANSNADADVDANANTDAHDEICDFTMTTIMTPMAHTLATSYMSSMLAVPRT